jgi:hypothetical protein
MSRIKQLKNESINNINIIELLSLLCNDKTKYVETLLRIIKGEKKHRTRIREIKSFLNKDISIPEDTINTIPDDHLMFFHTFIESMIGIEDLKKYQKFIEFNEKGLIQNNDLTTYKTFNQVISSMSIAEMKEFEKELKGQIIKVYEDYEWLLVKPLTYESSKKYGANTKWCTASSQTSDYFTNYTQTGTLIYIINKKSGKKIAIHRTYNKIITYWSQEDKNININDVDLPQNIESVITKCLRDERSNQLLYNNKKSIVEPPKQEITQRVRTLTNRVSRAIQREDNEIKLSVKKK